MWLPFDLHPEYPPEGLPRTDLDRRYGPGVHEHTRRMVETAGLTYGPSPKLPNTLHALQATELARDRGLHGPVHTRLMHAYWSEGKDLGDDEVLLELVAEAGVDRDEAVAELLKTCDGRRVTAVRARQQLTAWVDSEQDQHDAMQAIVLLDDVVAMLPA